MAGWMRQQTGDLERTKIQYDKASILIDTYHLADLEAYLLRKQAAWYVQKGQVDIAIECYNRALMLQQSLEDLTQLHGSYGELHRRRGYLDEAREHLQIALTLCKELEKSLLADLVKTRINLYAGLFYWKENWEKSYAHFQYASVLAKSIGAFEEWALAEKWLGTICSSRDEESPTEETIEHYIQAAVLFELLYNKDELVKLVNEYVPVLLLARKYEAALSICNRAVLLGITDWQTISWQYEAASAIGEQIH